MEWQPIETAPKDGTRIILYFPRTDIVIGGSWQEVRDGDWESGYHYWFEWKVDDKLFFMEDDPDWWNPTHWMPLMPLPEPPKE